jgi:hypothetical protein
MHQQIRGSPDSIAGNIARVVNALAKAEVNIEAIAPDFEPPHVRVLVDHENQNDPEAFDRALAALAEDGLAPEIRPAVLVTMPHHPKALKVALDRLAREGYVVESILVLPGSDNPEVARVSFGVTRSTIPDWEPIADDLATAVEGELATLFT